MRNTKFYYEKRHIDVKESFKQLKENWQEDFKNVVFDEKKNSLKDLN